MRSRGRGTVLVGVCAAAALALAACGGDENPNDGAGGCSPACGAGLTCQDGACKPSGGGGCKSDADCAGATPVCVVSTGACVAASDPCAACKEWESCNAAKQCVTKAGRCTKDAECAVACNLVDHVCALTACNPECSDWQICQNRACIPAQGRCARDADCDVNNPVCDKTLHLCGAPQVDTPSTLPGWPGLVITVDALRAPFERLARLHTLSGYPTRVVTVAEVCAAAPFTCDDSEPRRDTARAIKEYLLSRPGVEIVVLGGTADLVPARRVSDTFSNELWGESFQQTFLTDYYYADPSEWDTNRDGVYAQDGVDRPSYLPSIGVTRVPVSTAADANRYADKVLHHLTAYERDRIGTALLLSNVATSIPVGADEVDVDAAIYFEMAGRSASLLPSTYTLTKLYAQLAMPGAQALTTDLQRTELQRSHNLVVHAGHGGEYLLTTEVDGGNGFSASDARALVNAHKPFFLSCACSAGNLEVSDSAGAALVTAPNGGAIGYLGNSALGLGLAGGSQLIDEFLRYTFAHDRPRVGDALKAAHANMPTTDGIVLPEFIPGLGGTQVPTVDQVSYEWTQKSVVWLGDGILPVWTDPTIGAAPAVTVQRQLLGTFSKIVFTITPAVQGTLLVEIGSNVYERHVTGGTATITLAEHPSRVYWGLETATTLPALGDRTF